MEKGSKVQCLVDNIPYQSFTKGKEYTLTERDVIRTDRDHRYILTPADFDSGRFLATEITFLREDKTEHFRPDTEALAADQSLGALGDFLGHNPEKEKLNSDYLFDFGKKIDTEITNGSADMFAIQVKTKREFWALMDYYKSKGWICLNPACKVNDHTFKLFDLYDYGPDWNCYNSNDIKPYRRTIAFDIFSALTGVKVKEVVEIELHKDTLKAVIGKKTVSINDFYKKTSVDISYDDIAKITQAIAELNQ